jgi:hypothetical protein
MRLVLLSLIIADNVDDTLLSFYWLLITVYCLLTF